MGLTNGAMGLLWPDIEPFICHVALEIEICVVLQLHSCVGFTVLNRQLPLHLWVGRQFYASLGIVSLHAFAAIYLTIWPALVVYPCPMIILTPALLLTSLFNWCTHSEFCVHQISSMYLLLPLVDPNSTPFMHFLIISQCHYWIHSLNYFL